MKHIKIYLIGIVLILLFSGCTNEITPSNIEQKNEMPNYEETNNNVENNNGYSYDFSLGEPLSIDEVIEKSYFILKCNFVSTEKVNKQDSFGIYTFEFIDAIKGNFDAKKISVTIYDFDAFNEKDENIFTVGNEYVLCLQKSDNIFHGISYTLFSGLCMRLENSKILGVYQRGKLLEKTGIDTIESLKSKSSLIVKALENNNEEYMSGHKYTLSSDSEEIVKTSSFIVEAKIVENTTPNGVSEKVEEFKCETIKSYKGSIQDSFFVLVNANSVNVGDEYLLLLECLGGSSYVISSNYSCIPVSDTETYEEYMKYIDK